MQRLFIPVYSRLKITALLDKSKHDGELKTDLSKQKKICETMNRRQPIVVEQVIKTQEVYYGTT